MASNKIDNETINQLIEGAIESEELTCDDPDFNTDEARNVRDVFDDFDTEVRREVIRFVRDNPDVSPLTDRTNAHRISPAEFVDRLPDLTYLVYMSINGSGRTFLDGDWDPYFRLPIPKHNDLEDLQKRLKKNLREWSDSTGSGKIEEALREAAHAACPSLEEDEADDISAPTQAELNANIVIGDMKRGPGVGLAVLGKQLRSNLEFREAVSAVKALKRQHKAYSKLDVYYVDSDGSIDQLNAAGDKIRSWS